ncbi:hypothetical protein QQF64_003873 [Cirrhinus molitorella]|uniref:Uncharacterized protein n=1 Tax=Cirrhinus molitorella TaxID=172907 RepID=A0ABR3MMH7_9TELE
MGTVGGLYPPSSHPGSPRLNCSSPPPQMAVSRFLCSALRSNITITNRIIGISHKDGRLRSTWRCCGCFQQSGWTDGSVNVG